MPSEILSIYDALAAVTVSDGVREIAARNLAEQPNAINTADAPLRMLTVIDPLNSTDRARSDDVWGAAAGSGFYTVTWTLFDVLYHTPLAQGRGVRDVNVPLLTYIRNYYAMLAANTAALDTFGAVVQRTLMLPMVLEYPRQSGHAWYAVRCMLTIYESNCD